MVQQRNWAALAALAVMTFGISSAAEAGERRMRAAPGIEAATSDRFMTPIAGSKRRTDIARRARASVAARPFIRSDPSFPPPIAAAPPSNLAAPAVRRPIPGPRHAAPGGRQFRGVASYYWQGQRVASGGRFNPHGLTAAHRSLPFGTKVRVTDPRTGRSVVVTINDRGPFIRGRVLDLSLGAAKVLGMTGRGTMMVQADVI